MERTKSQTEKQLKNQKSQSKPDPKAKSLSEDDLDKVAGGGTIHGSRSNVKNN